MKHTVAALLAAAIAVSAFAAPPGKQPAAPEPLNLLDQRPDTDAAKASLGPAFESRAGGIALKPPAGCKEIHRGGSPDDIVEFVNDAHNWSLKVTRSTLSKPLPLTEYFDNGRKMPGVLEMTVDNLKRDNPTAEVVRQDLIDLGSNKVGMIATRTMVGTQRRLFQQAIIQSTETQYYVLIFNSPAAPKGASNTSDADPHEKEAVDTFTAVLDTVQLLDRSTIKEDQDQRLFRTRAFFVNLTDKRVKNALVPEQWLRLIHEGKDIGYTYVVEETYKQAGTEGVRIGVRSRTVPEKGTQVDAESWLFTSADRRHENWTNVAAIGDGKTTKDYSSEVGYSDVEVSHHVAANAKPGEKNAIVTDENHTLTVTRSSKSSNQKPVSRPVPPWYLPQAMGHLLPRLLPTDTTRAYLFATYVSDQGDVMARYIDIGKPADVSLLPGTPSQNLIPIKDRIGLEGSVTTHYVTADGKYVGSINPDSKVTILASDRESILKLWSDANLTRPKEPSSDNRPAANLK